MTKTVSRTTGGRVPVSEQSTSDAMSRLLTPDDLASLLGVPRPLGVKKASQGKIPAIKLGKAWRFRPSTIDAWLREQEHATRSEVAGS